MIDLPLLILCLAAALCLGLSRLVATRVLGYGATLAALLAALALFVTSRRASLPLDRVFGVWLVPDTLVVPLALRLDNMSLALGMVVCCGGAVALLTLALSVSASLRGFGTLFGWSLLVLAASFATICCATPLLLPYLWTIVALVSFAAVWSSGVLGRGAGVSPAAAYPLLAGPLLLIALLSALATADSNAALVIGTGATLCIALAVLLAAGLPPFRGSLDTLLAGPAALGGLLGAFGLPLVALATVWRLASATQPLAPFWNTALIVIGLLALLVCAAGALQEHALKALLGWQIGAQTGIVIIGLGLYRPGNLAAESGVWALLSNFALTTLAGMLAVAVFERGGSDDFTVPLDLPGTDTRAMRLAGIVWTAASASAIGLPPFWGFWGRRWLVDAALTQTPWVVPCVLMGSTLMALAYFAPLAAWFRSQSSPAVEQADTRTSNARDIALCGVLPATLCLLLGVAPSLGWPLPLEVGRLEQAVCVALVLAGLAAFALVRRLPHGRSMPADPDMEPIVLAPDALGDSLAAFAWLGKPHGLWQAVWTALLWVGGIAQTIMSLFERRYYLAGLLVALIIAILVMAQ